MWISSFPRILEANVSWIFRVYQLQCFRGIQFAKIVWEITAIHVFMWILLFLTVVGLCWGHIQTFNSACQKMTQKTLG